MRFTTSILATASFALSFLSLGLQVQGHGFVVSLSVDGTEYAGSNGPDASSDSPIRKVATGDPVTDETSDAIKCGTSAELASATATVNSGSVLEFQWASEGGGNWIHNFGPILTYMAKCSGDCASFTPDSSTEWFKIDEQGETVDGDGSTWAQAALTTGSPATVTLPDNIAAGNYLIRHEIIALQNAVSEGGAEFYPTCIQVEVQGDGTGTPDTTVNFPGAYSATDAGLLGDFYTDSSDYVFPGGAVANLVSSGSSSGSSSSGSSSSSTKTSTKTSGGSSTSSTGATISISASIGVANPASSPTSTSIAATTTAAATSASPTSTSGAVCRKRKRSTKKRSTRSRRNATIPAPEVDPALLKRAMQLHGKRRLSKNH